MATPLGMTVSSTEMVVAQFDDIAEGTTVESLIIEFDQAKYEEYLSSSSSGGKASRRYRRVVRVAQPQAAEAAMPEDSTRAPAGGPASSKPAKVEPMARGISRATAKQPTQPRVEEFKIHLGANHVVTIDAELTLSKRAKRRRRQTLARREAAASMAFEGLGHCSGLKKTKLERKVRSLEGLPKSGEPTYTGGPRSSGKIPKTSRLYISGEPHANSEVPHSGEPSEKGEPPKSGGVRSSNHYSESGKLPGTDELCSEGEPRQARLIGRKVGAGRWAEARRSAKPRPPRRTRQHSTHGKIPKCPHLGSLELSSPAVGPSNAGGCHYRPTGDLRDHLTHKHEHEVPKSGRLRQSVKPTYSGGFRSNSQVSNSGELRKSGELCSSGGSHKTGGLHQARLIAQLRPQADLRQKGKASARRTGALHQARRTGEPHQAEPRQHTRTQLGVAFPFGYAHSVPTSDDDDGYCSGVATSWTSSSIQGRNVEVHMTDISDEISRRFEEQQATLSEQQATINSMKEMLEQLLSEKKKKKRRTSRALQKSSGRKERMPTPHTSSDSSSESSGGASSSGHNPRDERLDELQSQLNALKLQGSMNKLGVARPYPIEWDTVSYPVEFEPLDLRQFDGKGSPTQHIYYFQAQTGHIMGNDPIMTRLFIGTLKGVAFEWFRRLEPGSITCWKDMERLFMARFFDDDTGVSVTTLLAAKQRKTESVSNFVKRFRNRSLRARDQISEATLIEMCRNNLSIDILSNMGAVVAHSWKDLTRQGEQVESVLKRMEVEELFEFRGSDDQDTLEMATTSSSNLFSSQKGFPFTSAELANSEPSYGTDCEDLATIGQR